MAGNFHAAAFLDKETALFGGKISRRRPREDFQCSYRVAIFSLAMCLSFVFPVLFFAKNSVEHLEMKGTATVEFGFRRN